ncbi:MAG: response regulator [Candidatus Melainabacteria bacterium]|nr:response regulator [Candidatus Melainabacteria bacterium]
MAKILLVEDDYVLANTLLDWLEFKGHEAEHSANGEEALAKMSTGNYNIIVLDWNLPGITGIEVCSQYRGLGGKLPVLMLTGMHGSSDEEKCKQAGANKYLSKPFQLEDLTRQVEILLAAGNLS